MSTHTTVEEFCAKAIPAVRTWKAVEDKSKGKQPSKFKGIIPTSKVQVYRFSDGQYYPVMDGDGKPVRASFNDLFEDKFPGKDPKTETGKLNGTFLDISPRRGLKGCVVTTLMSDYIEEQEEKQEQKAANAEKQTEARRAALSGLGL